MLQSKNLCLHFITPNYTKLNYFSNIIDNTLYSNYAFNITVFVFRSGYVLSSSIRFMEIGRNKDQNFGSRTNSFGAGIISGRMRVGCFGGAREGS